MFNKRTQLVNRKATIIIKLVVLKKTTTKQNKNETDKYEYFSKQRSLIFLPANIYQVNNIYVKNRYFISVFFFFKMFKLSPTEVQYIQLFFQPLSKFSNQRKE